MSPKINWTSTEWKSIADSLGEMVEERKTRLCTPMPEAETNGVRAEIRLLKKLLDWPNESKTTEQEVTFGL